MTISTEPAPLSYNGDGSTVNFSITWKYFAKSHVVATLRSTTGTETVWALTTNYTLTAAGVDAGGTLTAVTAPATGETLVITLEPPNTQESSLPLGGAFPSEDVEDALDLSAQRDSKFKNLINRTFRVPVTDTQSGTDLEFPIDTSRAGKYLAFDASGDPIASAGTGTAPAASTFMATVLDDTTAAAARATLDAQQDVLTTIGDTVIATTAGAAARLPASASVAAHATTSDVWTARETILTGGAVTFTDIADAPYVGAVAWVYQNAAHIWTDGAVFDVQGGATYTTAIGDWVRINAVTVSTFDVTIIKADGTAVVSGALAGQIIQVIEGTPYTTYASSTAAFPLDDTIPQNTEGTQIISDCTITPGSASNRLKIYAEISGLSNTSGPLQVAAAIFQDSTANALKVGVAATEGVDYAMQGFMFTHEMAAGTTSATTFKLRWGAMTAGTTYINGNSTTRLYGGVMSCRLWVQEIKV